MADTIQGQQQSPPWTGPSAGEMVRSKTLAHEVIARANDPCPVFDEEHLAVLRQYVFDTSPANVAALSAQHGWVLEEKEYGGSLIAYAIAMDAFREEDIVALRKFFEEREAGHDENLE